MPIKNLVVLNDYKTYKGINSTDADSKTSEVIASASAFVKNYCGRTFIDYTTSDKIERFNGSNKCSFYVQEYPIISITSINSSRDAQNTQTLLVENTDYYVDKEDGLITSAVGTFEPGHNSIEVVYKGGTLEIPADLKLAVLDLVSLFINKEYKPKQSSGSSISENFSSGEQPALLPAHIKNTLDLYKVS